MLQALLLEAIGGYLPPGLDPERLRVDIVRGRLSLSDLDLATGPINVVAGCPMRLTSGFIEHLELRLPWASLYSAPVQVDVGHIRLHFTEITYPQSLREVFSALGDAARRQKLRTLAESERVESAITRILQKFLPMLLDRIELNIRDVHIHIHLASGDTAVFRIEEIRTLPVPTPSAGKRGRTASELAKNLVVRGISVEIVLAPGRENGTPSSSTSSDEEINFKQGEERIVVVLKKTRFDVHLRFGRGVFNVDIDFDQHIDVSLNKSCVEMLVAVRRRTAQWNIAALCGRPTCFSLDNAKAWIRYALCVTTGRRLNVCSDFSLGRIRAAMRSFVEYKDLHVQRLRKRVKLRQAEEVRIAELEQTLDADMILLLRSQARKRVLTDEASAFAAQDWLSWALFGYRMSDGREQLASEIRQSLSVIERTDGESDEEAGPGASPMASMGWSKAIVRFSLKCVSVTTQDNLSQVVVALHGMVCRADIDASLAEYDVKFSVQDADVVNDSSSFFCKGLTAARAGTAVGSPFGAFARRKEGKSLVVVGLQKLSSDDAATMSVSVAPVSIRIDLARLSALLYVAHTFLLRQEDPGVGYLAEQDEPSSPCVKSAVTSGAVTKESASESRAVFRLNMDGVSMLLSSSRACHHDDVLFRDALLLNVGPMQVIAREVQGTNSVTVSCGFSLQPCVVSMQANSSLRFDDVSTESAMHIVDAEPVALKSQMTLKLSNELITTNIGEVCAHLTRSSARGACRVAVGVWFDWLALSDGFILTSPRAKHRALYCVTKKSLSATGGLRIARSSDREFRLYVAHVYVKLSSELGKDGNSVILSGNELSVTRHLDGTGLVSFHDLTVSEPVFGSTIRVRPESNQQHGLSASIAGTGTDGFVEVDAALTNVDVMLKAESLYRIGVLVAELKAILSKAALDVQTIHRDERSRRLSQDQWSEAGRIGITRLALLTTFVQVECIAETDRVVLECQRVYCVSEQTVWSGSVDGIKLTDLSGKSGNHDVAIRSTAVSGNLAPTAPRRITFHVAPGSVNVHLSSLQIMVLRPALEELVWMVKCIMSAAEQGLASVPSEATGPAQKNNNAGLRVTVQGTDLTLMLPCSAAEIRRACIDVHRVTVTIAPNAQIVSVRKLTLLTLHDRRQPPGVIPRNEDWAVVLRGLDLDFSHYLREVRPESNGYDNGRRATCTRTKSEWSVQVLSKLALFLAPSQIALVSSIFHHNLFRSSAASVRPFPLFMETASHESQRHQLTIIREDDKAEVGEMPTVSRPSGPIYNRVLVTVVTQVITLDCLSEDSQGWVASAIACATCGPLRFVRECLGEVQADLLQTSVRRWALDIYSLRIEDRRDGVVPAMRIVFNAHGGGTTENAGPSGESGTSSREYPGCIHVQHLTRLDHDDRTRSSMDVQLSEPRFIVCPGLFDDLRSFFALSALDGGDDPNGESSALSTDQDRKQTEGGPRRVSDCNESTGPILRGKNGIPNPREPSIAVSKLTVVAVRSHVFAVDKRVGPEARGMSLTARSFKMTLILSANGELLTGSQVRGRDLAMSMLSAESVFCGRDMRLVEPRSSFSGEGLGRARNRQSFAAPEARLMGSQQGPHRHSISVARERRTPSMLLRWSCASQEATVIATCKMVSVKLPTAHYPHVDVTIPGVNVDAAVDVFSEALVLLLHLDLFSDAELDTPFLMPPVTLNVRASSLCFRIPALSADTDAAFMSCARDGTITVRVRTAAHVALSNNMSKVTASVINLSADAFENSSGLRDQILAPCSFSMETDLVSSTLSVGAPRPLRVTVSPLTARALTGLALFARRAFQNPANDGLAHASSKKGDASVRAAFAEWLVVSIDVSGITICCVSEKPRTHLLRVVVRKVVADMRMPLMERGDGHLELTIDDIMLEDVISWRVYDANTWESNNNGWGTLVSGTNDLLDAYTVSRFPVPPTLVSSTVPRIFSGEALSRIPSRDSSAAGSRNEAPAARVPLITCVTTWQAPLEHLTAHVRMRGLDLKLNTTLLPSIASWARSIVMTVANVVNAHKRDPSTLPFTAEECISDTSDHELLHVGVDHILIEPIAIRFAARTPPRPIQQSLLWRIIDWAAGAESFSGIVVQTPRVVFNGDFDGISGLASRLASAYRSALTSRSVISQLFWQTPALARLLRIGAKIYLRRNQVLVIDGLHPARDRGRHNRNGAGASTAGASFMPEHGVGLAEALSGARMGAFTHTRTLPSHILGIRARDEQQGRVSGSTEQTPGGSGAVEILDISKMNAASPSPSVETRTRNVDMDKNVGIMHEGRELFLSLRQQDPELPMDERFEFFALFSLGTALLVTNHSLLFVDRSTNTICNRRVRRDSIAGYTLIDNVIAIQCVDLVPVPVAQTSARLFSRDTSELAQNVREQRVLPLFSTHELKCHTSEYARWLHKRLPAVGGVSSAREH